MRNHTLADRIASLYLANQKVVHRPLPGVIERLLRGAQEEAAARTSACLPLYGTVGVIGSFGPKTVGLGSQGQRTFHSCLFYVCAL